MSSIFGLCHIDKRPVTDSDMGLMLSGLNHWNADETGIWTNGHIGLGHLMLYNTPESQSEKQPVHNSLYRLTITADARIDNRGDLYSLLQLTTPEEKLLPDGDMILLLYKKYGSDCVKYLIGDFAFAILDEREDTIFCARDHMGIKPFFYYHDDHFFAFASEKKGLLCLPGVDKAIDKQYFYNLALIPQAVQAANTTLYKNIRRLAPAHTLTFCPSKNKLHLNKYWTLDAYKEIKLPRKEDYYEGLLHHFEDAVKSRLRSHYPVGAELSGGLDSSAITGAASHFLKNGQKNIITFSNTFSDEEAVNAAEWENERSYIDAVLKFNKIEDYELVTKNIWDDPMDEIEFALGVNDGPELLSPTWLMPIKKIAMQKNVRTLLSGFPGDEMVTYRGQYHFLDYLDTKQYAKYFSTRGEGAFNPLKPFMAPDMEFLVHKLKNVLVLNSNEMKSLGDLFKLSAKDRYSKGDVVWEDINYRERYKSYRHYQKYRLLKPQTALRMETETRFGFCYKTEPRYPMADIRLTQFYLSMPNTMKYGGELNRGTFREAVKRYLPDMVLQRNDKRGNIVPFKTSSEALRKRHDILLEELNKFNNNNMHNAIISKQSHTHIYNRLRFIQLLVWFNKNNF